MRYTERKRRTSYDIIVSAPKSVSVVAALKDHMNHRVVKAALRKLIPLLVATGLLLVPTNGFAVYPVLDQALNTLTTLNWTIDHTLKNTFHGEDIAKWVQSIANEGRQIANQYTQIMNQVEQLKRLGNPNYYINMLGLDQVLKSVQQLEGGVGAVLSEIQQTANGFSAMRYTAGGLYSDLTQMKDQFGNLVNFDEFSFRKFGAIYDLSDRYNNYLKSYNQSAQRLGQDVQQTLSKLNSDGTQIGAEKLRGKLQALQLQQQAVADQSQIAANKIVVQDVLNRTNDAQMREALRQKVFQDTVMQNQSTIMSGNLMTGSLPKTSDMGALKLAQ